MQKIQGVSIIELLIVIAIGSILAVIAIPTYQKYVLKARISELIGAANSYKVEMAEKILLQDPHDINQEYQSGSNNIDTIRLKSVGDEYVIHVNSSLMDDNNQPVLMQLVGSMQGNSLNWQCRVDAAQKELLPSNCIEGLVNIA